jgi:hypothetical protein
LPQIHARAAGRFLACQDDALQKLENLGAQDRMKPDPLQARQDGRQLVAALDGQDDPLDGDDLEGGLGFKTLAHGQYIAYTC